MELYHNDFGFLFRANPEELRQARIDKNMSPPFEGYSGNIKPPGEITEGVDGSTYTAYRKGLDSACTDVVITTTDDSGVHRVLASMRGPGKCFANTYWMHGGALFTYMSPAEFAIRRAEKECLVKAELQAVMGMSRTCAADFLASTLQLCYVAYAPFEAFRKAGTDADHSKVTLLSLQDIDKQPLGSIHPYPYMMFRAALKSMP